MFKESSTRLPAGTLHSAPAQRNTVPILDVLQRVLPDRGTVLELASGTGQHVIAFADKLRQLQWQPSDIDAELRDSVARRIDAAGLANVAAPIELDATHLPWPVARADAVLCINMIHISPWSATEGLFDGASRILPAGGIVVTYGPYMRDGAHTAQSNAAFDASLRQHNPAWGLRDVDAVAAVAERFGLRLIETVPMPANNFTLVFTLDENGPVAV